MSWLIVVAAILSRTIVPGANPDGAEVPRVGPIEWLRVMGKDSFEYCVAHPHQPDARFDILSDDIVPAEKGTVVRVKRQIVEWDGDTATAHDLGEMTVRLADLDASQVTKSALPCDRSRLMYPGLWQVRIALREDDNANETPETALYMTFEGPGKTWMAVRAWQEAIATAGGREMAYSPDRPEPWLPADEGDMEPSFRAFRERLRAILSRKDVDALMEVMDRDCKLSVDDQDGRNDLYRDWRPDSPDTELWTTLGEIIENGGMFYRGVNRYYKGDLVYDYPIKRKRYLLRREPEIPDAFLAPHWAHAPGWYEEVVVIEENVPVYAAADTSSEVLWTLSYEVVPGTWDFIPRRQATGSSSRAATRPGTWRVARSVLPWAIAPRSNEARTGTGRWPSSLRGTERGGV